MNLNDLKKQIDEGLLENLAASGFDDYFKKFLFNGAKRLRPIYVYLTAEFIDCPLDDKIFNLALAIEFLHSATLVHDDIIDDAKKRRSMPCLHLTNGNKAAVLAGDFLLANTMGLISKIKNPLIYEIIANASLRMAQSEIEALKGRFTKPDLSLYIKRSIQKTAPLFLAGAKGAYAIKGINPDAKFLEFSEKFALCFQIKDDINNASGMDTGKLSDDKKTGIITLDAISSFENCYDKIKAARDFLHKKVEDAKMCLKFFPPDCTHNFQLLFDLIEG